MEMIPNNKIFAILFYDLLFIRYFLNYYYTKGVAYNFDISVPNTISWPSRNISSMAFLSWTSRPA